MKRALLTPLTFRGWRRRSEARHGPTPGAFRVLAAALLLAAASAPAIIFDLDFGDAPLPYPTRANNNGAHHAIIQGFHLGQTVDGEADGMPNSTATGDDLNPPGVPDDEDGVRFLTLPLPPGGTARIEVVASTEGFLDAWVDFGGDGNWDSTNDRIFNGQPLNAGANTLTFPVPAQSAIGTTYARFRFSAQGGLRTTSFGGDGEVEDYMVDIAAAGELDFGDAPQNYPVLLANNGARHRILQGYFLGKLVDAENDGQSSTFANADDNNPVGAGDDEDGVRFLTSPLVAGAVAQIEVECSEDGHLDAWVDFNRDGDWADEGEQIFSSEVLIIGINALTFPVPGSAVTTENTYARFRFSQQGGLSYDGPAPDGEVEDYAIAVATADMDYGDAPDSYQTLLASDGPRHRAVQGFFLGSLLDVEPDGQPNAAANGDDINPSSAGDDEDGVSFSTPLIPGQTASVVVTASISGQLDAWVDFEIDGSFANRIDQIYSGGISTGPNTITFTVPNSAKLGATYARFRFSRDGKLPWFGFANEGEVEDYRVQISELFDYGDAPDPKYPTLLASDGARHRYNPDVFMGFNIDVEANGQPSSAANGDDFVVGGNPDDEDGVVFTSPIAGGTTASVEVRVSTSGLLNAWIDFGVDGSWAEEGDQIFRDQPVSGGVNNLTFSVPANLRTARTYARFRYNLQGGLTFTGPAEDGEVEDYVVSIQDRPIPCERTNKGRDFWLTFPGNYAPDPDNPLRLRLCIVGPRTTTGTVEIPGLGWSTNFVITVPERVVIVLPEEAELGDANDEILNNGIHVTASAEVAVFGLSRVLYTTDGYLGLPSDVLGREYIIQAFGNVHDAAPPLNGTQFGLVACDDDTEVTIVPSVAVAGHPAGVAYNITLNRGQTYQLRGTNGAPTDLSGTFIVGSKPLAVFGSHQCANIPDETVWFCDYIVEQILPEERASSSFVAMPLATRTGGDTYRYYAVDNNTQVFVNGVHVATLNRGEFHQQNVVGPMRVSAEGRIHVVQYANSSDFDLVTDSDPFEVVIPPPEMFRREYEICVPETAPFGANYVNVVVPSGAAGAVRLDGVPIPAAAYVPIPGSGFSGVQWPVTPGRHDLTTGAGGTAAPLPFGVIVYGWDEYDSYGFPGGMFFGDKTPPTVHCLETNFLYPAGIIQDVGPCEARMLDFRQFVIYTDNCPLGPNSVLIQTPPPGVLLDIGEHIVTMCITDSSGNTGCCEFTITVVDTSAPSIDCPPPIVADCQSGQGAVVTFNVPAISECQEKVPVTCVPPSGSLFPPGVTTVNCIATNILGKSATCSFPVTVRCLGVLRGPTAATAVITWTGGGVLQTANQLGSAAAWQDLTGAASPFTVTATNSPRFFRVRY